MGTKNKLMLTPGNRRRLKQLREAALNLGMSESHANHYAIETLNRELEIGDWMVVPKSAEAEHL